jgi:predicted nicotinamide N-methyase
MTDLQEALDLIFQNRAYNYLNNYTDVKQLEWGNLQDVQKILIDGPIDTIIASDVLYKPSSFPKLVQTLDWLSAENRRIDIYLGYKRRGLSVEDEQSFFDICAQKFHIHILSGRISSSFSLFKTQKQRNIQIDICKETGVNIYQLVRK